jgi:hypothetical protein
MKFMHTMGAIGLMGSMACLLVLLSFTPAPSSLSEYAVMRAGMGAIAKWIFLPSLALTLVSGMLAIAVNPAFHNAGWAWVKLATGILIFEWGFTAIQGPIQQEAELSASALTGEVGAETLAGAIAAEWNSLWVLLAVTVVNVVLGVWRPRITSLRK